LSFARLWFTEVLFERVLVVPEARFELAEPLLPTTAEAEPLPLPVDRAIVRPLAPAPAWPFSSETLVTRPLLLADAALLPTVRLLDRDLPLPFSSWTLASRLLPVVGDRLSADTLTSFPLRPGDLLRTVTLAARPLWAEFPRLPARTPGNVPAFIVPALLEPTVSFALAVVVFGVAVVTVTVALADLPPA
jgi:hypothetical protein